MRDESRFKTTRGRGMKTGRDKKGRGSKGRM